MLIFSKFILVFLPLIAGVIIIVAFQDGTAEMRIEKDIGFELKNTTVTPFRIWAFCEIKENQFYNCKDRDGFEAHSQHEKAESMQPTESKNKTAPEGGVLNAVQSEYEFIDTELQLNKPENIIFKHEITNIPKNKTCIKNEPSVGSNGTYIFYTGNHYASQSFDGGKNWNFIDPSIGFPFCCDQRVIYEKQNKIFIWYIQGELPDPREEVDENWVRLAVSTNLSKWAIYEFQPHYIDNDKLADLSMDFPNLSTNDEFLYLTSNIYGDNSTSEEPIRASIILRISLQELSQFKDLNVEQYYDKEGRTIKPVKGANSEMYLATFPYIDKEKNAEDKKIIRIYQINRSSHGQIYDRHVHEYIKLNGNGTDCGDPKKREWWCGSIDGRISTGWIDNDKIGFLWHANRYLNDEIFSRPVPYMDGAIFDINNKMREITTERPYLSNSLYTWGFGDVALNGNGDLGLIAFYGNKTTPINLAFGVYNQSAEPHWKMMSLLNSTVPITEPVFDKAKCYADYQLADPSLYQWGDYITINDYPINNAFWEIGAYVTNGTTINGRDVTGIHDVKPYYFILKN